MGQPPRCYGGAMSAAHVLANRRATPYLEEIDNYWRQENPEVGYRLWIGSAEAHCYRCQWLPPIPGNCRTYYRPWHRSAGWLERAHLADFAHLRDTSRVSDRKHRESLSDDPAPDGA